MNFKKNLLSRYKELLNCYWKISNKDEIFKYKPFSNFMELLYPYVVEDEFFSYELYESALVWYLESLEDLPNFDDDEKTNLSIRELISYIKKIFDINRGVHYLIFPLQGSRLSRDVSFSRFHFLIKKDETEIIKQISSITDIDESNVHDFLTHTKNSRSKDFLKSNIMIIKIENQTQNVTSSSYQMAQYSVDFLKLIHSAFGFENSIFLMGEIWEEENRHVAILSNDGWRCGHGYNWNAHLKCKIDLDFIFNDKYQNLFNNLFSIFSLGREVDDLMLRFENAFVLYSRGITQVAEQKDNDLALLLFITALESLITEDQYEKRLRISKIVPQLIEIKEFPASELSEILDGLYKQRNNFVHAGKSPVFNYENNNLKVLDQITGLLILKYFELDSILNFEVNKTKSEIWIDYLEDIYQGNNE
ncbi:HEPN domain-containing protein [Eubacteriaceae bacterium ES2]|nr:HEPN domain-containing protein [Eubacteriaceae bacterium ES2]